MLDEYITRFGRLHTDKNKKRWNQRTTFRAPHKPLLLLSVLDRFAEGAIESNLIEFDDELVALFNIYWQIVKPPSQRGVICYPLWHLQSEGFWHLLPRPGYEERVRHGGAINSIGSCAGMSSAQGSTKIFSNSCRKNKRVMYYVQF